MATEIDSDSELQMGRAPRSKPRRRTLLRVAAIVVCSGWILPAAAWGSGETLSVAINPGTPEQGVPASFAFSGETVATNGNGDGPSLEVEYRPTGGLGCQANFQNDHAAAGGASTILAASTELNGPWNAPIFDGPPPMEGPGPFNNSYEYSMPQPGTYLLCAYLEHAPEEQNAPMVVDASTSITFSVSPPKVEVFSVGLAAPAQPGQLFTIDYTTQTDQQLSLASIIVPAGGLPCAEDAGLFGEELRHNNEYELGPLFSEDESTHVFGGPKVTQATDTEAAAGPYIICSWIEGPSSNEVDAALTTPFYVGTPPPPPPAAKKPAPASDACLRDRGNVAHEELIVRRNERRLRARHLSRRARRADSEVLARARKALSKAQGLRRHQCPNGR